MAKPKVTQLPQNGSDKIDTLIHDEWLIKDKVRILIDVSDILSDMEAYQRQLMIARGIPQQPNAFDVNDPNIQIAMKFFENVKDDNQRENMALELLKGHYEDLTKEMQAYGFMLATTKSNSFDEEPKPYDKDWSKDNNLPAIASLPSPMPNLVFPVEYRLKQLLDILYDNPGSFLRLEKRMSTITIRINQRLTLGREAMPGE